MPQLLPNPWFFILVLSWLIFFIMMPQKILTHTYLNSPNPKNIKICSMAWNWPW